jgi:hypothetical protein
MLNIKETPNRVLEALAERGKTLRDIEHMSAEEALQYWLEGEGIFGYTYTIMTVVRGLIAAEFPARLKG